MVFDRGPSPDFGSPHIFPLHPPTKMHNNVMATMASTPRARAPARACDRCRRRKAKVRIHPPKGRLNRRIRDSLADNVDLASVILQTHLRFVAAVVQLRLNAHLICRSLDVDPRPNDTSLTARLTRTACTVPLHLLWGCRGQIPLCEDSVKLPRLSSHWKHGNLGFR